MNKSKTVYYVRSLWPADADGGEPWSSETDDMVTRAYARARRKVMLERGAVKATVYAVRGPTALDRLDPWSQESGWGRPDPRPMPQ